MTAVHLLDQRIGDRWPDLGSDDKVRAFEATPYAQRIAAQSTYEALRIGASNDPDAAAIHFLPKSDPGETPVTITHRQFIARVTQAANMFTALGIGPNDVVSLLLPLLPQSFFALFGAEAAGIANPVNPLLEASQLRSILRAAKTKVLVALGPAEGSDIWQKVERIRGDLPELKAIVVVGGAADEATAVHAFDARIAAEPDDRLVSGRRISGDDIAAYFHTGGTTGTPKLVRHTHANQVYQAWAMSLMLRSGPGRCVLFGLPLFHVGGALTQGLNGLAEGGTLVVLSPAGWRNPSSVRNVWKLVERYRPVVFGGVPTVLAGAMNVPIGDADISSVERCFGGGSGIPVAVGKYFQDKLNIPVLEVYGMTETASVHTMGYIDRPVRLGSTGHPLPYSRVRIVKLDPDGNFQGDCATGEIGVVAMHGPGAFSGYLSESHNRDAFVEPGWVNSGDLGRLDADGYLWITGRAKDLVIRGGHNIDPMAIEEVFYQHPAVGLAAVVGQPDAYAGELPVAFVQPKPDADLDLAELLAFVRERTPERAAVPVEIFAIDPMPLTGVGKVFKPALRWDAAQRVVTRMLDDLRQPGWTIDVAVAGHEVHGSLITVRLAGIPDQALGGLERQIHERLDPLVIRHEIAGRPA